jgi:hypothetical protein
MAPEPSPRTAPIGKKNSHDGATVYPTNAMATSALLAASNPPTPSFSIATPAQSPDRK